MAKAPKQKLSFNEKVQKDMPEFADEVASLSVQDLNNRLATLAKAAEESMQAKEDDEELEEAQTHSRELAAPYRDAAKMIRTKSKYIIGTIKEKGGA
jgi:hypothetical protein